MAAIGGLAAAIREDRAFDGSDPGPRLTEEHQDSIHFAICALGKIVQSDFHDLMNLLEVPA
ncbi:hypothetical protein D3C84_1185780 [compost metagenome]